MERTESQRHSGLLTSSTGSKKSMAKCLQNTVEGTALAVQWLTIYLAVQTMQVQSMV